MWMYARLHEFVGTTCLLVFTEARGCHFPLERVTVLSIHGVGAGNLTRVLWKS